MRSIVGVEAGVVYVVVPVALVLVFAVVFTALSEHSFFSLLLLLLLALASMPLKLLWVIPAGFLTITVFLHCLRTLIGGHVIQMNMNGRAVDGQKDIPQVRLI